MRRWLKEHLTILKIYIILIHNIHVEDEKVRFGYYDNYDAIL